MNRQFNPIILALAVLGLSCRIGEAAALTWDANGTAGPNPSDGSGAWLTANDWWNGTANVNGTWTGSAPDSAFFGAGTPGSYTISLGTVVASNLTFNTSGYTLAGGTLTLSGGNDLTNAANVNVTIVSSVNQGGSATWTMNPGSMLTLGGGGLGGGGNFVWRGGGTVFITNGTYTPTILWLQNITNLQTGGTMTSSSDTHVGYAGNTTYTINGGSASLTVGGKMVVGRGGNTGILNLQNGTVAANGLNTPGQPTLGIGFDGNSVGILNISGGIFTVASGKVLYLDYGATSSGGKGTLNLSGGALYAPTIQFGNGTTAYNPNTLAALNISGGTLYLGADGIALNSGGFVPGNNSVLISGGTIVATANWSSVLPMTLTNLNGDITIQAADALNSPFDVSLSGVLSGIGGLIKTGGGMLILTGTNTYTGNTTVNGGTIYLSGNGSLAGSGGLTITNGGSLVLMNSATNNVNRLSNSAPILMNGGTFAFMNDGSTASFGEIAGALIINSGTNLVVAFPAANGQTSTLTFSGLTYNGGLVDFQMSSAGTSQNKVLFTAAPTLGSWITVNGGPAVYDSTNGLHEATTFTDIAALGSTISNAPASEVRINSTGSGGNIQLNLATTAIDSLQQNTTTPAIVDTTGKTFRVNQITVNAGSQSLGIGAATGDGVLTAGSMGGNLTLINNGGFAPGLVINAVLADNVFPSSLTVLGSGTVTLAAPNYTFSGGTTISNGTLVVTTGTTVPMPFTNIGGALETKLGAVGTTLPMNAFTLGGNNPQLTFDLGGNTIVTGPLISVNGPLAMNSDVLVNVTNPVSGITVLLQYSGARTGAGRFKQGNMPTGAGIIDDPADKKVQLICLSGPTVIVPPLDTNEIVVAIATPQQYGATGDGVTDDSAAFQNALNAVYNSGGAGGGVVYVPAGTYGFSNSITIPPGVTVQGDWTDWSQATNGVTGTLFKVYAGAGQSNGTPFITINGGALKGVSIWYPNQDPANITPYPFTIYIPKDDVVVQDVALINAYQGISANNCAKHVISDVFGSPLYTGIQVDGEYDISHQENVRFSPDFWPNSKLPGAPISGGPHTTWMRANGVAECLYRCDGEACMDVAISGYNIGFDALVSVNGAPDASFYGGYISNCATAYLDGSGGGNTGEEFTCFTLDGDVAVDRATTSDASAYFHTCQITGRNGMSIRQTGGNSSTMQFQNCNVTGTVQVDGGIANFVNSSFSVAATSNHCAMASGAIYAAFTGCNFTPTRKISNSADARRLVIDGRRSITNALPRVNWADIQNDFSTRRPAKLDLFFATNAVGDGTNDDTAAIQTALNAAGANGGGIVYLPAGEYKLTDTLDVPSGVELRGSFPSRHPASLYDGHFKVTMLQPYGGGGTTNGPPAIALEANSGVVGLSLSYELQNTNIILYPPAIQGRGPNVYACGIQCPNAFWYVDLNTYTCTNHFFYDVNGWSLQYGFTIGNGSSGSIIHCMANSSYWGGNSGSASIYNSAWQPAVLNYVEHNTEWFLLGDCSELMVKNFQIFAHTFMHCITQNGSGPRITGILTMCDAAVECFRFESAANSVINIVNPEWMVTTADYPDLTGYGVISTPDFQGKARFFNAPLWGGRAWDYVIQGGDVGFELTHAGYLSTYGSKVDGGVAHFVNCGLEGGTSLYYTVPFNSTSNGVPGKISEIIGCYAWMGVTNSLINANNPVNQWGNFGINKLVNQTPFEVTPLQLFLQPDTAAQAVSLVWTNNMGAFNLCSTPDLASSAGWTPLTNVPYFSNNSWIVTDSATNAALRFYRLQQ